MADRLLGPERVLFVSAVGVMAGHISLAEQHEAAYFGVLGLIAIVVGAALALAARPIGRLMSGVR